MKIVFAASEAAPFIKTGGLGDVAQALPAALTRHPNTEVILFVPYYPAVKKNYGDSVKTVATFYMDLSWRRQYVGLLKLVSKSRKLQVYFIDNEYYFKRDTVYGCGDDGERFAYFSKAILESLVKLGEKPDVIHCNDWQTALIPALLHGFYEETLGSMKTVYTIHNIEYQGWTGTYFLGDVLGLPGKYENALRYGDSLDFMKGAITDCDALTTVSETYAREICNPYYAHGLEKVISDHSFKLSGIVNGIDLQSNDPASDPYLTENYDVNSFESGKKANKAALQKDLGLAVREEVPLVGMVSRLVSHKGLDILCEKLEELMQWDIQLAILGTGDPGYEAVLKGISSRHPDKFAFYCGFSKEYAARIYGGSDIYLMPSKAEPCGLSQLIAMHYGTVPVVHETGGLKDTVIPYDWTRGTGVGFTFYDFSGDNMLDALRRALTVYWTDRGGWKKIMRNGMKEDVSWNKPAAKYLELYRRICGK